jgi:CRP-like cAMP-binding protein
MLDSFTALAGAGGSRMGALAHADFDFASHGAVLGVLRREMLERVIASASIRRFAKGQALFRQGDLATTFFIIVHGWVSFTDSPRPATKW